MNVERILEELDLERRVIADRLAHVDAVLEQLRALQNGSQGAAPPAKARAGRGRAKDVDWQRCRQQYENGGVAVARLAQVFKVHVSAIYRQAKAEGWRRPAKGDA